MSEILFGQAYYLRFDPKLWEAMQPYPPLGTLYAASYIHSRGYDVALFDAMLAGSEEEWAQSLDLHQPRFAVLFEDNFNYLSKMCLLRMRQAAYEMIAMARRRGCTVIVCGADASDHAAEYLARGADFILIGEGEVTLGELLDCLTGRSKTSIESILGLAFLRASSNQESASNGPNSTLEFVRSPRRPDLRDLDSLPFPAWDLVDVPRYRGIWLQRHGYFSMNMVTTRGCPFHCNWCAKPIWGQRYNVRSPENVVAEMEWLKNAYQPDHIWFVDDIMGLKPGWLSSFAEQVEIHQVRLPFKCLNRADLLLRDGEINALERAGCRVVWIGAESGSQKILDAMDKGIRLKQIREAARRLHEVRIQVGFFLQFGYPGETRADIQKTFKLVHECRPDDIGMSVSYPLPGTRFFEGVRLQLGAKQNWIDSNDLAMLYHGPFPTEFYRQLYVVLHKKFRLQKARQRFIHPQSIEWIPSASDARKYPGRLRSLAALFYHALTLVPAQIRLAWLAHQPHQGIEPLPPSMLPESAAQPTRQNE